jgi:putative membrane protein
MWPGYQHMDPSWMGWMVGGSVLFWIVVVALVVFAVARLASPRPRGDDALAVLDQRLARGEIDADEYRSRRTLLLEH